MQLIHLLCIKDCLPNSWPARKRNLYLRRSQANLQSCYFGRFFFSSFHLALTHSQILILTHTYLVFLVKVLNWFQNNPSTKPVSSNMYICSVIYSSTTILHLNTNHFLFVYFNSFRVLHTINKTWYQSFKYPVEECLVCPVENK